jgi:hypothetical protein
MPQIGWHRMFFYAKAYDIVATFQYRTIGNPSGAQKTAEVENIVTTHDELI